MKRAPSFHPSETPLLTGITLIEASAGTGKTYAIAAIFLRLLLEQQLEVSEILVTTYTIPATAELRQRIRARLVGALAAFDAGKADDPFLAALLARVPANEAIQRLGRALRGFDEAAIHTIHSFCQRLLQDRAFESGLPFEAALLPDQSALLREVAEDYWRREFYEADPFLTVTALQHDLSPTALAKLLEIPVSHPSMVVKPATTRAEFAARKAQLVASFQRLRRLWKEDGGSIARPFTSEIAWAKHRYGNPAIMRPYLDQLNECFSQDGGPVAVFASLEIFARSALKRFTRAGHATPHHEFFDVCEALCSARAEYAVAVQADFLEWARAELSRRKMESNVVSFDDLLTRLREALSGSGGEALARAVRERFRAALIDEFQDTDPVQDAIFQELFGRATNGWLFLIGDPKQAIYAFRGADVFTYLKAARRATARFTLLENHRSEAPLVDGVNHLFERVRHPFVLEEIAFEPVHTPAEREEQTFTNGIHTGPPLHVWHYKSEAPISLGKAREHLSQVVAAEIARLLTGDARIGERRIVPQDIAVLVSRHHEARAVQAALIFSGVPSVLQSTGNVFQSHEAAELHTILAAVAEPGREPLLRAALGTDALGVTAPGLDALSRDERAWEERALCFVRYREIWSCAGFIQMFRDLLQKEHIRSRLLARLDGERRLTNLVHLAELLHQVAVERRLGPAGLIKWLAGQRDPDATSIEAYELRLERDDDAVRIVTMHKSKGLEYEVVFCPFVWGRPEARGRRSSDRGAKVRPITFHDPLEGNRLTLDIGSSSWSENETRANRETVAELVRLFYVALTRARRRCYFAWGQFSKSALSAPAWLLHQPPLPGDDVASALRAQAEQLTPGQVTRDLHALAQGAPSAIGIVDLPDATGPRYAPPRASSTFRKARLFHGRIERDWRVSSFTALTQNREEEVPDYDRAAPEHDLVESEVPPIGIHAFPGGSKAGICLHEIFEELDFCDPAAIEPLVQRKLAAFSFDRALWTHHVVQCIRNVLDVEIAPGIRLRTRPRATRLTELEFYFPVQHFDAASLQQLLHSETAGRLQFEPRRGLLKGFIDLIFEHEGRFHIVDWKSNVLGTDSATYTQGALTNAMARHHYALQYHLYSVALHRYLKLRLGARYDYDAHFGDIFYLFLRGIDPTDPALGVFRQRPARDLISQLEAFFGMA